MLDGFIVGLAKATPRWRYREPRTTFLLSVHGIKTRVCLFPEKEFTLFGQGQLQIFLYNTFVVECPIDERKVYKNFVVNPLKSSFQVHMSFLPFRLMENMSESSPLQNLITFEVSSKFKDQKQCSEFQTSETVASLEPAKR